MSISTVTGCTSLYTSSSCQDWLHVTTHVIVMPRLAARHYTRHRHAKTGYTSLYTSSSCQDWLHVTTHVIVMPRLATRHYTRHRHANILSDSGHERLHSHKQIIDQRIFHFSPFNCYLSVVRSLCGVILNERYFQPFVCLIQRYKRFKRTL